MQPFEYYVQLLMKKRDTPAIRRLKDWLNEYVYKTPAEDDIDFDDPPEPAVDDDELEWDALDVDDEIPAGADAELDTFFKKLYSDADDDTRRAMQKSFQESNGTALSTNWAEVGKSKTQTRAPAGMIAKRYDS